MAVRLGAHHGEAGGRDAARHSREIAEASQERKSMQARTVERAGSQIGGLATVFSGMLTRLLGKYESADATKTTFPNHPFAAQQPVLAMLQ